MLTTAAKTAATAAGHAATNKAKTTATNAAKDQVKKSFFRQRSAAEVIKRGRSDRASEAIIGYKQSKNLKVYGKHVDNLICEYCEIFYSYYEGDDALVPQLRLFEVQRDPTQCLPLQYIWPRTQKVSNAQPLNNLTDILRSPTDAAVYDFFKSMQAQDPELTKEKGKTSNPITVASYIIPVVVDRISSITDSKLLTELYTALSTFCKRLYAIGENYYGTYWTKDPYIVEFLKCNRKLIRSFSTESIKNYRVPTIDEFVPELFTNAGIVCVELQNIVRNFIPGQIIRSDINTPRCVGVKFDILHARGATVNEQLLIQEANSFPEIDAEADKRITNNTEEFIEFAMRADTNAERFIKYVFELASDKPDQEREKNKSRLLDSIIRRLDKQEEFIRLGPEKYPPLFEEITILDELKNSKRFKSLAGKEKKRILEHVKKNTIPKMSELFIKSIQFYRECVAMENAMRALKFYVEDSKSAVFTPNVKDFIEYLNTLYSRLTTFTQELVWFSGDEYFCYTEKDLMGENIEEYSGFITSIIEQARDCRNKISEAITLANSNTTETSIRKTRKNNLTSDRLKVFDISLHMLLCFNRAYPSYNVEHLVDIREKIWGKYAWSKVQSDCESDQDNSQNEDDLHAMCKKLKKFNGRTTTPHRHRKKTTRRPLRRNTAMINLQDGRETQRVIQKIENAAKKYDKYSMENRNGFGMLITGKHSDEQIQKAKDEASRMAEFSKNIQTEIDEKQSDAMIIIKKLYHAITLIIDQSSKEGKPFSQFVSDELLDTNSDTNNKPFKKYYDEHQTKKSIKSGNKQSSATRAIAKSTSDIIEEDQILTASERDWTSTDDEQTAHSENERGRSTYQFDDSDEWSNEETSYSDEESYHSDGESGHLESKEEQPSPRRKSKNNSNTNGSPRKANRSKHNDRSRHLSASKTADIDRHENKKTADELDQKNAPQTTDEAATSASNNRKDKKGKTKKRNSSSAKNKIVLFKPKEKQETKTKTLKKRASSYYDTSGYDTSDDEDHHHKSTVRSRRHSRLEYSCH